MKSIWRAIKFIPEYRGRVFGVLCVSAVLGGIAVVTPQVYKQIVDVLVKVISGRISHEDAASRVTLLIGGFFLLRLGVVVFTALQDKQADDLWLDAVSTFRQRVFDNMTRLSIDYFEKTRVGEIMDRFGAITQITMWLSSLTEGTLASILQMFLILGVLLAKSPLIGGVLTSVLVANFWISKRTVGWTKPYRRGWQTLAGRMAGLLAEMVGNIATVRSFGGEPSVKRRYDQTQAEWRITRGMLHTVEWRSTLALNITNALGVFIAFGLVAWGALKGKYTPGDILLVLTLTQNLFNSVQPISRQINNMSEIESSAERLIELLDVGAEVTDRPDAVELDSIESIEFEDVGFVYPSKQVVALENVSLGRAAAGSPPSSNCSCAFTIPPAAASRSTASICGTTSSARFAKDSALCFRTLPSSMTASERTSPSRGPRPRRNKFGPRRRQRMRTSSFSAWTTSMERWSESVASSSRAGKSSESPLRAPS
jgi:ABC-type multidrug transport system fused ATPase/permease subunit